MKKVFFTVVLYILTVALLSINHAEASTQNDFNDSIINNNRQVSSTVNFQDVYIVKAFKN